MSFFKSKKKGTEKPSSAPSKVEYNDDLDLSTSRETMQLKEYAAWSVSEVAAWLETLDLFDCKKSFWENAITGSVLVSLTEEDLKSLGVNKLGDRKRLLKEIGRLQGKALTLSTSRSASHRGTDDLAASASGSEDMQNSGSTSSTTERIYFKLHHDGDVRALKVDQGITLRKLRSEIKSMFGTRMRIKYKDDDGDMVSVRSEQDLMTLLKDLQLDGKRTCKLYLSKKSDGNEANAEKEKNVAARQAAFTIFDAFLDAVVVINDAGVVQYANPAIEVMTGYKPNELKGKNVSQLMTEEYKKFHDGYLRAYLKSRMPKIIGTGRDVIMQRKDGSITPIHLQVTEKIIGDKLYFFGTMKKATDAVQQKTMLQQEREVLDGLIVPAIIIDEKGTIHGFNGSATKLLGYSLVDVINRNVNMLMTSTDKERHDGYLTKYLETGKAKIIGVGRKVVAQSKDGSLKTLYLSVTEKKDKNKRIYTGILQEVTT